MERQDSLPTSLGLGFINHGNEHGIYITSGLDLIIRRERVLECLLAHQCLWRSLFLPF